MIWFEWTCLICILKSCVLGVNRLGGNRRVLSNGLIWGDSNDLVSGSSRPYPWFISALKMDVFRTAWWCMIDCLMPIMVSLHQPSDNLIGKMPSTQGKTFASQRRYTRVRVVHYRSWGSMDVSRLTWVFVPDLISVHPGFDDRHRESTHPTKAHPQPLYMIIWKWYHINDIIHKITHESEIISLIIKITRESDIMIMIHQWYNP